MVGVIGTDGADTLNGGAGDDSIAGLGGNDVVAGLAGRDTLVGGEGDDALSGGDGADSLEGGEGRDTLDGGAGADASDGGAGDDLITDSLVFGYGVEVAATVAAADRNTLSGGAGDDTIRVTVTSYSTPDGVTATQAIDGGAGYDRFVPVNALGDLVAFDLRPFRFTGIEELVLPVRTSPQTVIGDLRVSAADVAGLQAISSTISGQALFKGEGDFSRISLIGVTGIAISGGYAVVGSVGDDRIAIQPGGMADGASGDDRLAYTRGGTLLGGAGNDVISVDDGNFFAFDAQGVFRLQYLPDLLATMDGGSGIDRLRLGLPDAAYDITGASIANFEILEHSQRVVLLPGQLAGFTTLDLRVFVDRLDPGSPLFMRTAYFESGAAGLYDFSNKIFLSSNVVDFTGRGFAESVFGATGNDILRGFAGNDRLHGQAGADRLDGGAGDDLLVGGLGNDTLQGGDGRDLLDAGAGFNTVCGGMGFDQLNLDGGRRAAGLAFSVEFTTLEGTARIPSLAGTATTASQTTSFSGIERLGFTDGAVVTDSAGLALVTVRIYQAAFARTADSIGLSDHVHLLENGLSVQTLADVFAGSAEFRARFGTPDNAGFVSQMYRNALGREADAEGFGFWTSLLDLNIVSRGFVLREFALSAEGIARGQALMPQGVWLLDHDAAAVARLYQATLGRHPEEQGLSDWLGALDSGLSLRDIVPAFLGSAEAQALYGQPDDAAFLTTLYANVLGRAPDGPGFANWSAALAGGMSRADVVLGFSESAEFIALTAPWIAEGIVFA